MTDEQKIEQAAEEYANDCYRNEPNEEPSAHASFQAGVAWRDQNPKPLPEDLAKHREELRLMEARTMKLVSDIEAEMQKAGPVTGPIYYGEIAKLLIDWHAERRTFRGDATGEGEK